MPGCLEIEVDRDVCYVRFGHLKEPSRRTRDLGLTVRGETIIADIDADGRIVGLELVGGKPCQRAET